MYYNLREKTEADNAEITRIIRRWGSEILISQGKIYSASDLEGIIACVDEKIAGVCLYYINSRECEIVLFDVSKQKIGIGSTLINKTLEIAKNAGCKRLWLTTSNDNIDAIKFYQRRGFYIVNVHVEGMQDARKIKPEIPLKGNYDIPIRDEFEFEIQL
jgi:N-acetylglutamate synthase-like GNAT family acetyltransferase